MPKVIQAINNFLAARKASHNGPDLIDRFLQHGQCLETQVNVSVGAGFAVPGKRSTYSDGLDEWFNIRIPKHADTEPKFRDFELTFPLDLHADAIGCTGWDWAHRCSRFLGYDFDSITGHAAGVGITDADLEKVRAIACAIPWVEVRRSTGGNGLHLYAILEESGVPTENHTVHAALGRAVLGMLSSETNFDFAQHVDACGGNMWIWARKMTEENRGLALLKPATETLKLADLPVNWRDHIQVVNGKRSKIRVGGIPDEALDPFEALASSRQMIPLDEDHKKLIDELRTKKGSVIWAPDFHLLQTHTVLLQELHQTGGYKGFFKTNSQGKDPGQPNCFLFPLPSGAWKVYRFSPGIAEAETWEQDGQGWTTSYFNHSPSLKVAARALGGVEDEKGNFVFDTADKAMEASRALGRELDLPERMLSRETSLRAHRDGRLVVSIESKAGDGDMRQLGWDASKKGFWTKVFETRFEQETNDLSPCQYDELVRMVMSTSRVGVAWMCRCATDGGWNRVARDDAKSQLVNAGFSMTRAMAILGDASKNGWTLVNMPFQPEYPGNRQWNLDAAQYRYKPAELRDDEAPHHPHWDAILKHCGQDLDASLKDLDWARAANIKSGAEYLRMWIACMLREPYEKLPYLFLYGEQNSGKSILAEAAGLLMTKGVAAADRALTNSNDFNGELANAVLAVVEEKNISLSPGAYNKLKDWVTSPTLWIRKMRTDAYPQPNTLHFIQTANERDACVIKSGDTRITMMFVPALDLGQEIPKSVLFERLKEEAPHFMRTLMDLQLPPMTGRLRLPVVDTANKQLAEDSSRSPLERFIEEVCYYVPGETTPLVDFAPRFREWMIAEEIPECAEWDSKQKITRNLPFKFPYGVRSSNVRSIGNLSFEPPNPHAPEQRPLVGTNGKLRPKDG